MSEPTLNELNARRAMLKSEIARARRSGRKVDHLLFDLRRIESLIVARINAS